MSLRYVWEKWNTQEGYEIDTTSSRQFSQCFHWNLNEDEPRWGTTMVYAPSNSTSESIPSNKDFVNMLNNTDSWTKSTFSYTRDYFGGDNPKRYTSYRNWVLFLDETDGASWYYDKNDNNPMILGKNGGKPVRAIFAGNIKLSATFSRLGIASNVMYEKITVDSSYPMAILGNIKGSTSYGNVTSGNRSGYPDNNYTGNYWYVYKGSDSIDPLRVEYPSPRGGQAVAVNIIPTTSNTYGGTIYYKVEYKLDSADWVTHTTSTQSTSLTITVPIGTNQFTVRVTASDSTGFTSTTPVVGETKEVVNNNGARYVWGQYNYINGYFQANNQVLPTAANDGNSLYFNNYDSGTSKYVSTLYVSASSATMTLFSGTAYTLDRNTGLYTLSNRQQVGTVTKGGTLSVTAGTYYALVYTGSATNYATIFTPMASGTITITQPSGSPTRCYPTCTQTCNRLYSAQGTTQGSTSYGDKSSSNNDTYPINGVSGEYFYVYRGVDSIDPTNLQVTPSSVLAGDDLTMSVTASTQKEYGGNTIYNWEYSTDGGLQWNPVTSTQTTSYEWPVPQTGITSLLIRVHASDDIGFTSSVYLTLDDDNEITVVNNQPPTMPSSISVQNVMVGETIQVTWGTSTDPDGTVVEYSLERSIDNSQFTVVATKQASESLTFSETAQDGWSTVQYRVRAKDNEGAYSQYNTSQSFVVQDGMLYIGDQYSTPMGAMDKPFNFTFTMGWTGEVDDLVSLSYTMQLDNLPWSSGKKPITEAVSNEIEIQVPIDTRAFSTGNHTIYLELHGLNQSDTPLDATLYPVTKTYTFSVTATELADEGYLTQLEDNNVQPIFPITIASAVFMDDGKSLADTIEGFHNVAHYRTGSYVGTGTTDPGVVLTFPFEPQLLIVSRSDSADYYAIFIRNVTKAATCTSNGAWPTVAWSGKQVSWSAAGTAALNLNTSGVTYRYIVFA